MGGEKITIMVLKVDLQCCCCYKKVKKILCKFPQIRDQTYDEKVNTVTITVVCCNPEKLRDKLCSKGCGVITSIEIKKPPKPKPPKDTEVPKPPAVTPPPAPQPITVTQVSIQENHPPPPGYCCGQSDKPKPENHPPPPGYCCGQSDKPKPENHPPPPGYCCGQSDKPKPKNLPPPPGYCCGQCYEGRTGGPCYQWYGRPAPPPPCCDNYGCYGAGPYGYGRVCYVSRCDQHFYYENDPGCSIM